MKAREIFDSIRHQKRNKPSLRLRLVLLVCGELIISVLLALGVDFLLRNVLFKDHDIPLVLELLSAALLVSVVLTNLLGRQFFDPIKALGKAMEQVADGDYTVQIYTKSTAKEIQEIYSGFNLMTQELSATEILQTDFIANVSHEFKTPINAIDGYCMLLQDCDNLDATEKGYLDKIIFNAKRLSELTGSVLLLSKLENQSITTKQTRFRLDEQIRQSIVSLESAWEKKQIDFDVELDTVEYFGNEGLTRHIWDNLIGNAIKFDPQGGWVRVRLSRQQDAIVFSVADNGPGIGEVAKKHIFDKFYQADNSHKDEGNGLGLSLVKRIVGLEGGQIQVDSPPEGGCVFTVRLPVK